MEFDTWELTFSQELLPRTLSCSHSPFLLGVVAPPGMGKVNLILDCIFTLLTTGSYESLIPLPGFRFLTRDCTDTTHGWISLL
jgi:hypothetical protein